MYDTTKIETIWEWIKQTVSIGFAIGWDFIEMFSEVKWPVQLAAQFHNQVGIISECFDL